MRMNSSVPAVGRMTSPATQAAVIGAHRRNGSRDTITNAKGEFNASSYQDLVQAFIEVASRVNGGEFVSALREEAGTDVSATERRQLMLDAYHDHSSNRAWAELGSAISADIVDAVARSGFMRHLLAKGEVAQGAFPRVRVRHRNIEAFAAVGPTTVAMQMPRDGYILPKEFHIVARPYVSEIDIAQGSSDLLQEKFADATESFMVQEDRLLKAQFDAASSLVNTVQLFSGAVSPSVISLLAKEVTGWSLPASNLLFAIDILSDLQIAENWGKLFGPVTQLELLMTGKLGTILGMEVWTDGMRNPRLRVLNQGEIYVTSSPETLGAYTERGPIQAAPQGPAETSVPGRGWMMSEMISQAVANPRAVACARKIGSFTNF